MKEFRLCMEYRDGTTAFEKWWAHTAELAVRQKLALVDKEQLRSIEAIEVLNVWKWSFQ